MSMLKKEENMAKLGATFPLAQIITYEQCMKVGAVLTPPSPPHIEYMTAKKIGNTWSQRRGLCHRYEIGS
jgi:hypothetical protein